MEKKTTICDVCKKEKKPDEEGWIWIRQLHITTWIEGKLIPEFYLTAGPKHYPNFDVEKEYDFCSKECAKLFITKFIKHQLHILLNKYQLV